MAAAQLQTFGKAMGIPADQLQSPKVANHGTFVMAVTNDWIYTADVSGNQTFRPVSNLLILTQNLDADGNTSYKASNIARTVRDVAHTLSLDRDTPLPKTILKDDLLIVGRCDNPKQLEYHKGCCLARISTNDEQTYVQVVSGNRRQPFRVDSNIGSDVTRKMSVMLFEAMHTDVGYSKFDVLSDISLEAIS